MNEIVDPGSIYIGQRLDLPYIICYKDKYENEYWYKQIRFVEGVGITPDLFLGTVVAVVGVKVLPPLIDDMSLHTYTWFATHVGLKIVHYRALARQKITSTYDRIVKNIAPIRAPMSTERTPKIINASELKMSKTVQNHMNDIIKKGANKGDLARPYIDSNGTTLLVDEIMQAGTPVKDTVLKNGLRWDVQGTFRGSTGTWELVVDIGSNTIVHFNFVAK